MSPCTSVPVEGRRLPAPRRAGDDVVVPAAAAGLTDRDLELLRHLADGLSTAGIAGAMSLSGNTARTRIRRLERKLGAADRAQVVAGARGLGVV